MGIVRGGLAIDSTARGYPDSSRVIQPLAGAKATPMPGPGGRDRLGGCVIGMSTELGGRVGWVGHRTVPAVSLAAWRMAPPPH